MIDGVGEPQEAVGDDEEPIAGQHRGGRDGDAAQDQASRQHGARPDPVDQEAGRRLQQGGSGIERREREADLDVADAERRADFAEQRRQQHDVHVAHEMRHGDQRDHLVFAGLLRIAAGVAGRQVE